MVSSPPDLMHACDVCEEEIELVQHISEYISCAHIQKSNSMQQPVLQSRKYLPSLAHDNTLFSKFHTRELTIHILALFIRKEDV